MSRLHSMSDDDRVLSGEREPAVPLSILANERHPSTWHTFTVRRSEDQEAINQAVGFLEDMVADLRDRIGMTDADDLDGEGWRLVDRVESAHVALGFACRELRDLL